MNAARVELTRALEKDVLLVERFDRPATGGRRAMVSALTVLELDEIAGRYASYAETWSRASGARCATSQV